MKALLLFALGGLVLVVGSSVPAETKVVLKGTHLCCGQCVKAVGQILQKVEGCAGTCDQDAGTVTITAPDAATAQKALDALAAGGFHGTTDGPDLKIKDDSGATKGKVKSLTLVGVHNCCAGCTQAITAAVSKVAGVTGNTAKARSDTFDVTGDFDALELIQALNAAGYHAKVKK